MFRRGNLGRFMITASVLLLNGAVIVYFFERHAPAANIRSLGESLWWAVTTVSTVGYGDFYPVTIPGQITATFIMAIAVLVLAVVTAEIASSFIDQAAHRRVNATAADPAGDHVTLTDLDQRLAASNSSSPQSRTRTDRDDESVRVVRLVGRARYKRDASADISEMLHRLAITRTGQVGCTPPSRVIILLLPAERGGRPMTMVTTRPPGRGLLPRRF